MQSLTNSCKEDLQSYNCDLCKDTEVIIYVDEQGRTFTRECTCKKINDSKRRLQRTALANKAEKYTLETYSTNEEWQKNILARAKEYATNFNGDWLYIGGQPGAGKTHICTGIVQALSFKYNLSYDYILFNKKMTELKQAKFDDKESYKENIQRLIEVDVLFIDDLYKIEPTKADIDILFDIINERYLNNKTCIFSSEKNAKEIIVFDEAIASRIFEKCGNYVIGIAKDINKNYRLKQ